MSVWSEAVSHQVHGLRHDPWNRRFQQTPVPVEILPKKKKGKLMETFLQVSALLQTKQSLTLACVRECPHLKELYGLCWDKLAKRHCCCPGYSTQPETQSEGEQPSGWCWLVSLSLLPNNQFSTSYIKLI